MKITNKRKINSKTIENLGLNYFTKEKNKNKNSRSHKTLKIYPKEFINNFNKHSDSSGINNSLTASDYKTEIINENNKNFYLNNSNLGELFDEEINYDIDTTNKNFHDTTDSSKIKKENENENESKNSIENHEINDYNIYNNIHKNSTQKEYWLEEKNRYIQELEKKIQSQEKAINNLSKYKKLFEENISKKNKNSPKIEVNFASLENDLNYDYSNRKLLKKINKEDIRNKTYNDKFENNKINSEIDEINIIKEKKQNLKDKYNVLYSKYLQLNNDFKYLNNNNQIKFKYEKILEEYKILKNQLEEKNKIIDIQKNEINKLKNNENSNCKIQYIIGGEQEKQVIKNLKQQIEVFKKDLVLSQAMIKSLKSEIAQLNKNKNITSINSADTNINTNRNNSIDKYVFTFNENNQNKTSTPIFKNEKIINYNDNNNPQNLINSLNNKNQLLTKVLEENNQLRNRLKNIDKYFPGFEEVNNYDKIKEEIHNKNIIRKYEEKFKYFNAYIKCVKTIIQKIYEDIPIIINKNTNKDKIENKIISNKFIINLYEIRKEYNCLKKIDYYNLDITDDEKCIKIFQNIMKILNEELESIIKYKNNENEIDKKLLYDSKKINLKDLNLDKNTFIENDLNNILIKKNKDKKFGDESLLKINDKNSFKFIIDHKNKGNKNDIKSRQKGLYNFEYGMNADESEFLEKKYKTIFNNIEI